MSGLPINRTGDSLIVGVPKETFPWERRVALTPAVIPLFAKKGIEVVVESGAGVAAGYPDSACREKGAQIGTSRADLFAADDVILQVRALGANPEAGRGGHAPFCNGHGPTAP